MYYAVIHRPEIDVSLINGVRKKYDPTYKVISAHVTLIFPIPAKEVDGDSLKDHILSVARNTKPFSVQLADLEISWDQWLFLTPTKGKTEFNDLHDKLYGEILGRFLRTDIPFVPHVSLGHFADKESNYDLKNPKKLKLDDSLYNKARKEIEELHINYDYTATKIELVSINDSFTSSETLETFSLG